jgi:hypothetical protein
MKMPQINPNQCEYNLAHEIDPGAWFSTEFNHPINSEKEERARLRRGRALYDARKQFINKTGEK